MAFYYQNWYKETCNGLKCWAFMKGLDFFNGTGAHVLDPSKHVARIKLYKADNFVPIFKLIYCIKCNSKRISKPGNLFHLYKGQVMHRICCSNKYESFFGESMKFLLLWQFIERNFDVLSVAANYTHQLNKSKELHSSPEIDFHEHPNLYFLVCS